MEPFWNFIDSIRQKPKEVRSHAAFWAAACLTFLVGLLWVSTLPAQFSRISDSASNAAAGDAVSGFKEKVSESANVVPKDTEVKGSALNFEPANFATGTVRVAPNKAPSSTSTSSTTPATDAPQKSVLIETVPRGESGN